MKVIVEDYTSDKSKVPLNVPIIFNLPLTYNLPLPIKIDNCLQYHYFGIDKFASKDTKHFIGNNPGNKSQSNYNGLLSKIMFNQTCDYKYFESKKNQSFTNFIPFFTQKNVTKK